MRITVANVVLAVVMAGCGTLMGITFGMLSAERNKRTIVGLGLLVGLIVGVVALLAVGFENTGAP